MREEFRGTFRDGFHGREEEKGANSDGRVERRSLSQVFFVTFPSTTTKLSAPGQSVLATTMTIVNLWGRFEATLCFSHLILLSKRIHLDFRGSVTSNASRYEFTINACHPRDAIRCRFLSSGLIVRNFGGFLVRTAAGRTRTSTSLGGRLLLSKTTDRGRGPPPRASKVHETTEILNQKVRFLSFFNRLFYRTTTF